MGDGQARVGFWVSVTVTVKLQLGPALVVQVTVVTPTGKLIPDAGVQVTIAPQSPVVVGGGYMTVAAQVPIGAATGG